MTPTQIQLYRAIRAEMTVARNAYHLCLQTRASDAERHAAERRCRAAASVMEAFMTSLAPRCGAALAD